VVYKELGAVTLVVYMSGTNATVVVSRRSLNFLVEWGGGHSQLWLSGSGCVLVVSGRVV